jgi:hypothetical protein
MTTDPARLLTEKLLSLYEAARRFPPARAGRPVSFSCVLRWITDGIPGPDGERVKLEAVRVGGRWLTSEEALARWAARLTPRLHVENAPAPRSPARCRRESERAGRELDKIGIEGT